MSKTLLEVQQEYHYLRVALIGVTDMEERQLLRQRYKEAERKLNELRANDHGYRGGGLPGGQEDGGGQPAELCPPGGEEWGSHLRVPLAALDGGLLREADDQ